MCKGNGKRKEHAEAFNLNAQTLSSCIVDAATFIFGCLCIELAYFLLNFFLHPDAAASISQCQGILFSYPFKFNAQAFILNASGCSLRIFHCLCTLWSHFCSFDSNAQFITYKTKQGVKKFKVIIKLTKLLSI